ncbi:unnamed protein product [Mytilus edulis]|uniref:Uncharacterized protein n=1 Tax=Mytilus edulis TaxID=6550 RepID=A0A8S3SBX7_MYTED|nr:unnamed protein product [Mytilus edulis]
MRTFRIYACRILPAGKFLILDANKRQLLLFSNDGIFIRIVVTFIGYQFEPCFVLDACFIRNITVAVTLGSANKTILADIEKNKIIRTIKVSHYCYGVASDSDTLLISSNDRQSTRVNLNDMSHTTLERLKGIGYISLFKGNIYGTNHYENKVCCNKSTGEPLWTFQHKDIDRPVGITLGKNGFVYIVSSGTGSVVVISSDGKTCKPILLGAEGVKSPWAIDTNKETGMMIVPTKTKEGSTSYETAFVYKI